MIADDEAFNIGVLINFFKKYSPENIYDINIIKAFDGLQAYKIFLK